MGADFSRIRNNPLLDFAGVELKQGGVVLDADFNELVALLDRRLRAAASDILGRSTVSSTTPDAFKIAVASGTLQIGKGRLYVDGLLAENHGAVSSDPAKKLFDPLLGEVSYADPILYTAQPFLLNPPALPTSGRHLVYLDVWDRDVTHLERPDLVEVAVGVETSSRRQTVWQVRVLQPDSGGATCSSDDQDVPGWSALIAPSSGRLTSGTFDAPPETDPCELPPSGGFRGLENQTYRVEIHDAGQPGGTATFKWSRENASVGSRVTSMVSAGELELQTLGRDDVLRFNTGDWVEITDDVLEQSQHSGEMRRITVNEAARRITFTPALPGDMVPGAFPNSDFPRDRNLRVRRWDQSHKVLRTGAGGTTTVFQDLDAGTSGVVTVPAAGTTLLLENGVTVGFASTGGAGFRAGDYWVFAARTADASVELLVNEPPRGIHHHYERLGIWDVGAGTVTDCRHPWPPAGEGHDCSCGACVTPESHASGQFTIQDAVNLVQQTGGTVCLSAGQYALSEPVRLTNARSVRVRGQGPATIITTPGGAFALRNCIAVAIENLLILSLGQQPAISVATALGLALQQMAIAVVATRDNANASAIALGGVIAGATIRENAILAPVGILANDVVPAGTDERGPTFLITAALGIDDNLLWCQRQAVAFAGTVGHLFSSRITGNQVVGCSDTAVSLLGIGAPGSSMTVGRNSFMVTGSGVRAGIDGLWIDDNKLFNSDTTAAARRAEIGIALATGLDKSGADQCQILANQISGFAQAGILIGAPTRELIVKMNIIEKCGNGILSADDADGGSISIENNHLRDIGAAAAPTVVGIGVVRATSATIAGNMIRAIAVETAQSTLAAAILSMAVQRVRVSGNEVSGMGPAGNFVGVMAGIMLRTPYAEFEISHNRVQRDETPSTQASNGAWFAVLIGDPNVDAPVGRIANLAAVRVDSTRLVVLGAGRPFVATMADTAPVSTTTAATGAARAVAGVAAPLADNVATLALNVAAAASVAVARGSITGNVLAARGASAAVQVVAAGECLFNDNRVEARVPRVAAVVLATPVAIVNANRVRGGEPSIQLTATTASAAVLGNVTTGTIAVSGGLLAPWDSLNLRA
jgi:hypothetical protein